MEKPTAKSYFTPEDWEKLPVYERDRLDTKLANCLEMRRLGFNMPVPDFVVAWGAKANLEKQKLKKPSSKSAKCARKRKHPKSSSQSESDHASQGRAGTSSQKQELPDQRNKAADLLKMLSLSEGQEFHGFTPEDAIRSRKVATRLQGLYRKVDAKYQEAVAVYEGLKKELHEKEEQLRLMREQESRKNKMKATLLQKKNQATSSNNQAGALPPKKVLQATSSMDQACALPPKKVLQAAPRMDAIKDVVAVETHGKENQSGNVLLPATEETAVQRYPCRKRAAVNYEEPKLLDDDEYLFCDSCQQEHPGVCPVHGKLQLVTDRQLPVGYKEPDRALRTLPCVLAVTQSSITGAGLGVWAHVLLPKGVVFGPYEGQRTRLKATTGNAASGYSWIIKRANKVIGEMDAADTSVSNWMRYVNCAVYKTQQNIMSFQFQGRLYYRTVQETTAHTELMVYYGDHFARLLGIDTRIFHSGFVSLAQPAVFPCSNCKLAFTSPILRDRHVRLSCRLRTFNEPVKAVLPYVEPLPKKVPAVFEINPELNEPGPEGKKRFKCGECCFSSDNSSHFKYHTATHTKERSFECTECNYKAILKAHLERHLLTHSGEKPHACTECSYKTGYKSHLARHMLKHTGEKPFKCQQCDFACTTSSSLARHVRAKHTKQHPFACPDCSYTCAYSGSLASHKLTHSDEKKFSCQHCDYKCNHAGNLKKHMATKHTG